MSSPCYYALAQSDGSYAVYHSERGLIEDGFEYRSTAFDFIAECEANDAEVAQHALPESLADAVADFLSDLDRHGLTDRLSVGLAEDRCEIASLRALRSAHAAVAAPARRVA